MAPRAVQELDDIRSAEKEVAQLEARFGFLPPGDPVQAQVDAVARRLLSAGAELGGKPAPRVHVLVDHPHADAFVLANGVVCLTPAFLKLLETEDQLAAVLAHEFTHYLSGHFLPEVRGTGIKKRAGGMRLQEYEADITASVRWLGRAGFQPMAMATLCEVLQRVPHFKGWGVVHGTLEDRRLNVRTLEHLPIVNLEGIERAETPLPADWSECLPVIPRTQNDTRFEQQLSRVRSSDDRALQALHQELREEPSVHSWELLRQSLPRLLARATTELKTEGSFYLGTMGWLSRTVQELDALLEARVPALSDPHRRTLALLGLLAGPLELPLLIPPGKETKPLLDQLPLTLKDGTRFSARVQDAIIELGPASVAAGVCPQLATLPGAEALILLEPELFVLHLAHYAATLEVFVGLNSGRPSPALLARGVEQVLSAVAQRTREGSVTPVEPTSLREDLLHQAITRWGFQLPELVPRCVRPSDPADSRLLSTLALRTKTRLEGQTPVSDAFLNLVAFLMTGPAVGKQDEADQVDRIGAHAEASVARDYFYSAPDFANDLQAALGSLSTGDAETLIRRLGNAMYFMESELRGESAGFDLSAPADMTRVTWPQLFVAAQRRLDEDFPAVARDLFDSYVDHILLVPWEELESTDVFRLVELLDATTRHHHGGNPIWVADQSNLDRKLLSVLIKGMRSHATAESWTLLERLAPYCAPGRPMQDTPRLLDDTTTMSQLHIERLWPTAQGSPQRLLLLSTLFLDADIRQRIGAYAVDLSKATMGFEQARSIAFGPGSDLTVTGPLAEHMMETLAVTPAQMETLKQDFSKLYARQAAQATGNVTALDAFMELSFKRSEELVTAGLESVDSDRSLAMLSLEEWWGYLAETSVLGDFDGTLIDYFDTREALEEWAATPLGRLPQPKNPEDRARSTMATMGNVTELMERLQGATNSSKHVMARKLLMGQGNGVLRNREQTGALLEKLCQHHLDLTPAALQEVRRVGQSLQRVASSDELYFLLGPQLALRLFQRSQHVAPRGKLVQELVRGRVDESLGGGTVIEELRPQVQGKFKTKAQALSSKIRKSAFPRDALLGGVLNAERKVLAELPAEYRTAASSPRLGGMEALLKLASQLGAGPVRGLQVAGQYLDLDDATLESFSAAYDDVFGQSKMAAMETIKAHAPRLLAPEDELVGRLGGGSLVSVYDLKKAASSPMVAGNPPPGGEYVVKVLNPNAMARTRKVLDLGRRVLTDLRTHHPDRKEYELFAGMIDDLEEWIDADIHDTTFGQFDPTFRARFDGFKARDHRFAIKVPQSYASNQWVKVEEKVEGKNLTQFRRAAKTDFAAGTLSAADFQDAISAYTKCFWEQLRTGTVLSDVSKGNVRLTPRNQVTVLDRQLYQTLTEEDRALFKSMLSDPKPGVVLDYLLAQDRNAAARGDRSGLLTRIQARLTATDLGSGQGLRALVVALRQEKLRFPLRMTLLLKNLNAIDKLAQEAGFGDGIKGALLHKTSLVEKLKLWGELKK